MRIKKEDKQNKYYISFDGYVTIDAKNEDEATELFWQGLRCLTLNGYDDYYDINTIETDNK